jgi:hypothetical protein
MSDSTKALDENVSRHLAAISVCLANQYRMPALALIYCGIDVFAALNRPAAQAGTTRHDFIEWCNRYLLPGNSLACTAADLYAARCAILHTYTSKSSHTRSGKARQIIYAWGKRSAKELQQIIDLTGKSTHVAVHIETLAHAFEKAVHAFLHEALADTHRAPTLESRASELFLDHDRIL